jgi:hypothetical protein
MPRFLQRQPLDRRKPKLCQDASDQNDKPPKVSVLRARIEKRRLPGTELKARQIDQENQRNFDLLIARPNFATLAEAKRRRVCQKQRVSIAGCFVQAARP